MATQKKKIITDEIATAEKDYDLFSGYLNWMANPDKVLQLELGGDIRKYEDIGRDTHVAGALRTRTLAVIGKEWDIIPGTEGYSGHGKRDQSQAQNIADYIKQVFLSFEFDTTRRAMLRGGLLKGFAVSEVMWNLSEGDISIDAMLHKSQHRFAFTPAGDLRMITLSNMILGEELPENKFQVLTFGDEPTTPYGIGLARELYWPWWFKKNGIKFWMMFSDKFGSPTPIGKYPVGASPAQQASLLKACEAIQTDAGVIHPDTMSVELLEATRNGVSTYGELCDFMNSEMSKAILGHSAASDSTSGKLGNENQAGDIRVDIIKADADILCGSINNQVIKWLVDYQFGAQVRYPKMWINCDPGDDLKMRSEVDTAINNMGYRPTEDYIRETYSIDVEPFVQPKQNNPFGTTGQNGMPGQKQFTEQKKVHQTDILSNKMHDAISLDEIINNVKSLMNESSTLQELTAKMVDMYKSTDTEKIVAIIKDALIASKLGGILNVGS